MIDFPASPTVGQQFTDAGVTWVWDGTKWVASGVSTAYLPLVGGTLTGPLVLNADPTAALGAATKQYVDADLGYGGHINKFRNGTFDVWQRGIGPFNTAGYTADGWFVSSNGSAVSVSAGTGIGSTRRALTITGAGGNLGVLIYQRIESYVTAPLAGKRVTAQFRIQNNSGGAITPQLLTYYASSADVWGATADLPATNLQSIANGATGVVAYTFTPTANAVNGYGVYLQLPALVSGTVSVSEADVRVTPGLPVGLCANPPTPELRHVQAELAFCQRYFEKSYDDNIAPGATNSLNGQFLVFISGPTGVVGGGNYVPFRVTKRAVPTMTFYSPVTGTSGNLRNQFTTADIAAGASVIGMNGFYWTTGSLTAAAGVNVTGHFTASAEL